MTAWNVEQKVTKVKNSRREHCCLKFYGNEIKQHSDMEDWKEICQISQGESHFPFLILFKKFLVLIAMLGWTIEEVLLHLSPTSITATISNCRGEVPSSLKLLGQLPLNSAREDLDDESPKLGSYLSLGQLGEGVEFWRLWATSSSERRLKIRPLN